MYCRNCGEEITDPKAVVCLKCGVKVGDGNKFCANCGATPDPKAIVCVKCGSSLRTSSPNTGGGELVDSFGGAIKSCIQKFSTFEGRANRAEYWWWALFSFLVSFVCIIPIIGWLILIAMLIPSIAVGVRRLHDIGKSGLFYLLCLIPLVGSIILFIFALQPSQEGENEYGPNPNA